MTKVVGLCAGPGAGKSTTAADIYRQLKQAGINAELVREYVKDWAWEDRKPDIFDQIYFLGKQSRRESMLFGKVDVIVTDSPLWLCAYYSQKHAPPLIRNGIENMVMGFMLEAKRQGHDYHHVWIQRSKNYLPKGRFETEEQAREIDNQMKDFFLSRGVELHQLGTEERFVKNFSRELIDSLRVDQ